MLAPFKLSPTEITQAKELLVVCGKQFYERGWMWGTAGNLSVKLADFPLEIAITPSGVNKGNIRPDDLLTVLEGRPTSHPRGFVPSAETLIHQQIYRSAPEATAVFHAHPMYSTVLSGYYGDPKVVRSLKIDWIEMMKAVGCSEGEIGEIAVLPNWQDVSFVARDLEQFLKMQKGKKIPAVLLYNHGLTVWGRSADEARNHLEVIEYVSQFLYLKGVAENHFPPLATSARR